MLAGFHFFTASALTLNLTSNQFLAPLIGFLFHHFEDYLPHLDINIYHNEKLSSIKNWTKEVWFLTILEFLFFFLLTFYFLSFYSFPKQLIAFLGGLGALIPDIISFSINSFFPNFKLLNFYQNFHKKYHWKLKNKKISSYLLPIFVQGLFFLFALWLFNKR